MSSLHSREWTSWAAKHGNEFDSGWLILQEKFGGDSCGSACNFSKQKPSFSNQKLDL